MIGPVDVRFLDDGRSVLVLRPFSYKQWTVPAGFISDGASIPWELWTLIGSPYTGKYRRAAILHDFLYRTQKDVNRRQADDILHEAMRADGTGPIKAYVIWLGVRSIGGRISWNNDKRLIAHL